MESKAALALSVIDAGGLIALGVWTNNRVKEQRDKIDNLQSSLDQLSAYIRTNLDPKEVSNNSRLTDNMQHRIETLERVVEAQNAMIQSLINALSNANIDFEVPPEVKIHSQDDTPMVVSKGEEVDRERYVIERRELSSMEDDADIEEVVSRTMS